MWACYLCPHVLLPGRVQTGLIFYWLVAVLGKKGMLASVVISDLEGKLEPLA